MPRLIRRHAQRRVLLVVESCKKCVEKTESAVVCRNSTAERGCSVTLLDGRRLHRPNREVNSPESIELPMAANNVA
jgi:hypothetical protein